MSVVSLHVAPPDLGRHDEFAGKELLLLDSDMRGFLKGRGNRHPQAVPCFS